MSQNTVVLSYLLKELPITALVRAHQSLAPSQVIRPVVMYHPSLFMR